MTGYARVREPGPRARAGGGRRAASRCHPAPWPPSRHSAPPGSGPGQFLVTRGSGDKADGPVYNTRLIGNVAHGAVVSYDWQPGSGTLLIMKDNHVASVSQDGGFVDAGGTVIGS